MIQRHKREYKAFFMAIKVAIASVVIDEMKERLSPFGLKVSVFKLEAEVRAIDLVIVYWQTLLHLDGDVHVLCMKGAHWDHLLIRRKLLVVSEHPPYQKHAVALSVRHPDTQSSVW